MKKLFAQIADCWIHPEQASQSVKPLVAFLGLSCLVFAGCLALGPYPITKFPQDTSYFLSQGDLLLKGYRPYVDYCSIHGPFTFLFSAAGMYFHGVSLDSVILAQVLGAALFGAMMFKIANSRVNAFWAIVLAISIELMLVTCTPVGSKTWREFTCAMWYNTIGYCVLATVSLYLLAPSRTDSKLSTSIDYFIIAFLLMASFLTKLSYFVPIAAAYVFGDVIMPRQGQARISGLMVLTLAAALTVAVMAALGGSIVGYLQFLGAMSIKVSPLMLALRFLHYTMTLGQFLLGILLLAWFAYEAGLLRQLYREELLIVLLLGAWVVSAATSAQDLEILSMLGIVPLAATVVLVTIARRQALPINKYLVSATLAIALLLIVQVPKNSLLSWGFSHIKVPTLADPVERMSPGEINRLSFHLSPRVSRKLLAWMPKEYAEHQIEGLSLLQRFKVDPHDVLYVAADQSSINMFDDAKYPAGYVAWWPFIFLDDPEKIPLLDPQLLADADWILRDKTYESFWKYLTFHRGEFLEEQFEPVGDEGQWTLYRRRPK